MPTQVSYIVCDHQGCDGHVEYFARTKGYRSSACGAELEFSTFYRCQKCEAIYIQHTNADGFARDLQWYPGGLTYGQLRKYVPEYLGEWYDSAEKQALVSIANYKANPKGFSVDREVEKSEIAYVKVLSQWFGRKVKVTLVD
jgi:hypothetical protein